MPIYEYECAVCGGISELLEGMTVEQTARKCRVCGSEDLKRILSKGVTSRMSQIMGSRGGRTCCGREERCDTAPLCAQGTACHK
jgi:putative FmdB family regulatory protein